MGPCGKGLQPASSAQAPANHKRTSPEAFVEHPAPQPPPPQTQHTASRPLAWGRGAGLPGEAFRDGMEPATRWRTVNPTPFLSWLVTRENGAARLPLSEKGLLLTLALGVAGKTPQQEGAPKGLSSARSTQTRLLLLLAQKA